MKVIKDRYDSPLFIADVEYECFTSLSLMTEMNCHLEAEQVEELIEVLQDRLKEMKG